MPNSVMPLGRTVWMKGIAAAISEHRFRDVIFLVFDPRESAGSIGHLPIARTPGRPHARIDCRFAAASCNGAGYVQVVRVGEHLVPEATCGIFRSTSRRPRCSFCNRCTGKTNFSKRWQELLIVIPLAILFAGVGGYLLARRSLSPVVVMGAQASRIGSENLYERLQVQNPRTNLGSLRGPSMSCSIASINPSTARDDSLRMPPMSCAPR